MKLDFSSVWQYWPFLYHGALTTLKITAMAAVLGFILGVLLSLIKISKCKPLVWFGNFYTSIFRGTPLLVQLCIVHFAFRRNRYDPYHDAVRCADLLTELSCIYFRDFPWRNQCP